MRYSAALLPLLLLAACSTPPDPVTVAGTLTVPGGYAHGGLEGGPGQPCAVDGGYSDIRAGAQVVVTDASGKTLALGQLDGGTLQLPDPDEWGTRSCRFPFAVPAPGGHAFYGVEVTHRGVLRYTAEQLRRPVEISLGRR